MVQLKIEKKDIAEILELIQEEVRYNVKNEVNYCIDSKVESRLKKFTHKAMADLINRPDVRSVILKGIVKDAAQDIMASLRTDIRCILEDECRRKGIKVGE